MCAVLSCFSSVQFSSVAQSCPTLCDTMNCSTPDLPVITNPQSLLKLMPIESVMSSSHLILCRPILLHPPILPSIRVFSNSSHEVAKVLEFQLQHQSFQRIPRTDLLLKSLLQHHSSKASIFQCSAFFTVQLSHPYMMTGKTIALTRQT